MEIKTNYFKAVSLIFIFCEEIPDSAENLITRLPSTNYFPGWMLVISSHIKAFSLPALKQEDSCWYLYSQYLVLFFILSSKLNTNCPIFYYTTGCPTKHDPHGFCLISLATNILEIHWKGGMHSFVWSTETFLYNIREPRYKQIKIGYQISKCWNIGKSSVWKSETAAIYE